MNNYLILGGDLRQIYLGRMLKQQGLPTVTSADLGRLNLSLEEAIKASSVLLCPVPFTKDGKTIFSTDQKDSLKITDLLRHLTPDNTLFGGNIPDFVKDHAKEHKIPYFDFLEIEEITLENTIATAEGAIAEAIRLSPDCLHQSRCLVTGFGRCGKTLACKLQGLSADVTVADRDPVQLAFGTALGLKTKPLSEISQDIGEYHFIFNTIPAPVIREAEIRLMRPDVTIIDIASAPGGVDFTACKSREINARLCPGLPGAYVIHGEILCFSVWQTSHWKAYSKGVYMKLEGKKIGLAITGSFCTFSKMEEAVTALMAEGASIYPIISTNVQTTDSRFGDTTEFISHISDLTGNPPILKLEDAEPIGPQGYLDILLIAPCTGNTLAKLANGITDTPVLMAAKAHLRNSKPLVISISTNDALGINFKNIGQLFNIKNIYFVPFGQDNAIKKPNSMIARTDQIVRTLEEALEGKQIQPVIL